MKYSHARALRFIQDLRLKVYPLWSAIILFPAALRLSGSPAILFKKISTVYKRDGFRGLYRRLNSISGAGALGRINFEKWINLYDPLTSDQVEFYKQRIQHYGVRPTISILMPVYNPNLDWLAEAIQSVVDQIYPHWELCIVDDASTKDGVRDVLDRFSKLDPRIKVHSSCENGHISKASNIGLSMATGDWVALLDHDDVLSLHALFWAVDAINAQPTAAMLYSDEAKIGRGDIRYDAYFKPDWNVDLFLSQNMVNHLGVYKTSIMRDIGGFRVGYEGAQDYDLALRYIEKISQDQIVHIPRVLYFWRAHNDSTASSGEAKSYAAIAGERALNDYFSRNQIKAKVSATQFGFARTYALPDELPLVSIVIPTRNALALVKQCIDSILDKTDYLNYEIVLIDNNSDDPAALNYFKSLSINPRVRVIRDEQEFNYSAINNDAVRVSRGEVVCLLNNDIEVINTEWLNEMVGLVLQPGVGAVGAKLLYPDGRIQHAGVVIGVGGVAGHSHKYLDENLSGYFSRAQLISAYSAVTGACLVVKKALFNEVGGLDADNLKIAFNDIDFCLKLREKGYRNIWTPYSRLYHHESATRGAEDTPEKVKRFNEEVEWMMQRWDGQLQNDPAYSPNLTLKHEDFSYAWPPRV
jgi:glycosyltransferase involved in cell wall biosynthesis